jgi:hypothetical protein
MYQPLGGNQKYLMRLFLLFKLPSQNFSSVGVALSIAAVQFALNSKQLGNLN